jgi:hypothetical protein
MGLEWWYKPKETKEEQLIDYLEHELEVFGDQETMEILIDTEDLRRIVGALKCQREHIPDVGFDFWDGWKLLILDGRARFEIRDLE